MVRIALMGDLHYPQITDQNQELLEAKEKFFSNYFNIFFTTEADLYLSIGDLTHEGLQEEFQEVYRYVQKYGRSFRQVLGNHDVLGVPKRTISSLIRHPFYDSIETEEALLILLDTTKEQQLHGWGLDSEQSVWLRNHIHSSLNKPMLVFAHHPVPGTTLSSPSHDGHFEAFQDIRPILKERGGPGFYFNGHTHSHSIASKENWHYIQTAAALCDPCFRIIEINKDGICIETVSVNDRRLEEGRQVLYNKLPGFHQPDDMNRLDSELGLKKRFT
jgi:predicted phosphodiesterase